MIYSFSPFGYDGTIVTVETDLRRGIPATDIVGMSDGTVKETRERIQAAIKNCGFEYPPERVLISLSPADLKKEGSGFDLPIALSILEQAKKEEFDTYNDLPVLVMGELELSGHIRNVKGVYSALQTAIISNIKYAIIPKNAEQEPDGILCFRVDSLEDAFYALKNLYEGKAEELFESKKSTPAVDAGIEFEDFDFKDNFDNLKTDGLKYAMAVAVAGRHNLITWGNPGCGKTMTLQNLPLIMPKLMSDEAISTRRIWSLAGLTKPSKNIEIRPFRIPHQTASIEGICGGGPNCRPGEISLAHNGILFLDEAAEFRSSVIQMLRVPIENHNITLCRAGRSTVYPARFQLFMTTNPCPCGNYGSKEKICLCSVKSIDLYWKKFGAPLLDRIGIRYDFNADNTAFPKYTLEEIRHHIKLAWERQFARQGKLNNDLSPEEINQYILLTKNAQYVLDKAGDKYGYSPRAVVQIMKIAQTLNDMHETPSEQITELEIKMAIELHRPTPFMDI